MALAKIRTYALVGIEAVPVEVEVDVATSGLPITKVVGLAETVVRESIDRVERALLNSGYRKPTSRVIVNLAPGDLKKDAAAFDLPIALGILAGTGQIAPELLRPFAVTGELALDGSTRPIKGSLSMALATAAGTATNGLAPSRLIVPLANANEAAVTTDVDVFPVSSLTEAVGLITGDLPVEPFVVDVEQLFAIAPEKLVDFAEVKGQESAKRALLISACGMHNILMLGTPGTGKTMLAKRLPTIMAPLTLAESLETTRIYSAIGQTSAQQPLVTARPFRSPHHTSSEVGLIGGGIIPQPGEVSLSHHGVLFLDEFPEFSRRALEVLRQPLEDGVVAVTRARGKVVFPARFLLVAAMNPCPCGYATDPIRQCSCSPQLIERYLSKISGPLLDRIDIQVEVPAIPFDELRSRRTGSTSAELRAKVIRVREIQRQRFPDDPLMLNSRMTGQILQRFCQLDTTGELLLRKAVEELGLSIRAHDRILRVARTIADLEESENVQPGHLAEAIQLRRLDRKLGTAT